MAKLADTKNKITVLIKRFNLASMYKKYHAYTMIPPTRYMNNLLLSDMIRPLPGDIVECGTWKGGMIAGFANYLGSDREYFLFDSFQGLPKAKDVDGIQALAWQNNVNSPFYYNNCTADKKDAEEAMKLSKAKNFHIHQGWFSETLHTYDPKLGGISLLHLDCDWYDSTMDCLNALYKYVLPGGIILVDDYFAWEGSSKAIHDFLSQNQLPSRIYQFRNDVCFIIKSAYPVS
jgi:O-methyltransferase